MCIGRFWLLVFWLLLAVMLRAYFPVCLRCWYECFEGFRVGIGCLLLGAFVLDDISWFA